MSGDVERLAEVIGDHYDVVFFNGVWCCSCLLVLASHKVDAKVRYYRHLADAVLASDWLAAHDAEVAARALREAADGIEPGEHNCFKPWCPLCAMRKQRESTREDLHARADRVAGHTPQEQP